MARVGIDGIDGLRNLPSLRPLQHRALEKLPAFPLEARAPGSGSSAQINSPPIAGRNEGGALANSAMTIDTFYGGRGARFTVEFAIAMDLILKMTIDTMHAAGQMDILEV